MKNIILLLSFILIYSPAYARDTSQAIRELDKQIASASTPKSIANLHVFKARQLLAAGKVDRAITSYIESLRANQKGSTWVELGNLYFKTGEYEKAFIVTAKVVSKYPHLDEGAALLKKSIAEQKRIFNQLFPETIIINSPVKGKRTRFDYEDPHARNRAILADARNNDKKHRKQINDIYTQKAHALAANYRNKLADAKQRERQKNGGNHSELVREQRQERDLLYKDPVAYVPLELRKKNNSSTYPHLSRGDGEDDAQAGRQKLTGSGEYADGYEDEKEKKFNRNSTINGEWDTHGRHYTPAGSGNAWRDDGTFMQKTAGGYIDTKTGQFVFAN